MTIFNPATALGFDGITKDLMLSCDVVIVGAGAGGAAAARVLSQNGLKVIVVESGPKASRFKNNYANVARYHMQEGGTMVAQGSAMMPIAAGKGIGGSTLINSALSFRAPDSVLTHWSDILEDDAWSPQALAPLYDTISELIGVGITPEHIAGENNNLIVRGIQKLGWDGGLAPRSTPNCVGCGVCYFGCPSGGKGSMDRTLFPLAQQFDCQIYAETEVRNILIQDNQAVGIEGITVHPESKEMGFKLTIKAQRVILAAGAIGTPKLLWYTGLAKQMGSLVGEGLHVHPGSTLLATSPTAIHMWKGATQGAYCHPPDLPGVLPHTFSAPPEACLLAGGFIGSTWQEGLALLPNLCGMLVMVSDKGNGRVRAHADGRADISYEFHPEDVQRIKQGLVAVAKILLAGGAKDLRAPIQGIGICQSAEELEKRLVDRKIQDFTLYAAHPMSTCRMGATPEKGVIDANGQSFHFKNLFIADASVFPSSLGVNPQLSTMVCATQIAQKMIHSSP